MSAKKFTSILTLLILLCCSNMASAQWVQQGNPTGFYLEDVFFLNANTGWMCGNGVCKTTDGGNNWTFLSRPEIDKNYSVYFLDANTGFMGGYNFWKTTNGGNNWINIGVDGTNFRDIIFINSTTGWIAGNTGNFKTTDAGNSWQESNTGLSINYERVSFTNANTGWICGWNGVIIKTTNGGTNWVQQTTGVTNTLRTISFSDANTGRAGGNNGTFLRTTNGGANWISEAGPFGDDYYNLFFVNSSTGWLSGYNGVALTTNNGTSWINQTPSTLNFFKAIVFISPSTLYTVGFYPYKSSSAGFNLNAPTNLTLTPATTSAINLSWTDNSTDEDKFMIERSTDGNNWTVIDSVNAGITTYQSTGLAYNIDYYYKVRAKKIIWEGNYSNTANDRPLLASPTHSSPANNSFIAVPALSWSSVSGAVVYFLQIATDTSFNNIVYNHSDIGYNSQTFSQGTLQNSTRYYWRTKVTNFGNESAYSPFWSFTVQDSNYGNNMQTSFELYYFANSTAGANLSPSKPTYNWRDTTGSTNLIINQSGSPTAGNLDNGYFLVTNPLGANRSRVFGVNYPNVYIGTNGIVAFAPYDPTAVNAYQLTDAGIPQADIVTAAFPFWTDLYFQTIGVGSRLCYKASPDELVITYTKAQLYAPGGLLNSNLYISFQIIIHAPVGFQNSKIEIEYNFNESGSDLKNRITNNTMPRHLIGLQGANLPSRVVNYRFENSLYQYPYYGPIFGSNMALAFGPDANLLPVELSSFTSTVNYSNIKLEWSTVNEQNNSGFDIERTIANENNWKKINFVQGSGTTNQAKNYSYEDRNITSGKYQYRLKQIDFNGNYEYHSLANEVEIGVPKKFSLSQNYPNPFNPATKINFEIPQNSNVKLSVYDVTGKLAIELVNEQRAAGYYTVEFNGSNLASGMYFYRIEAGDFSATKKMLLIK